VTTTQRPLAGCVVNLSVSESDDSTKLGYPSWQVNRVTLQLVAALFGQGASVVFGHDWREDGVMEAVHGFALQMQPPIPLSADNVAAEAQPLLRNLLPWPDSPHLSERDIERLSSTLRVEPAGLPEELRAPAEEALRADRSNELYRYIRARGLTFLRHRLNDACHVRLCLGGRRAGAAGRYPGVIEEALLAMRDNKPLYLAGFLGGATGQVIDAIEGRQMPDDFCGTSPLKLYQEPPVKEFDAGTRDDRLIDRNAIWLEFAEAGSARLVATNGLTAEENDALLHTRVVDQVIELVLIGLSRVWQNMAQGQENMRMENGS
jgi:SLOG cluster2